MKRQVVREGGKKEAREREKRERDKKVSGRVKRRWNRKDVKYNASEETIII